MSGETSLRQGSARSESTDTSSNCCIDSLESPQSTLSDAIAPSSRILLCLTSGFPLAGAARSCRAKR